MPRDSSNWTFIDRTCIRCGKKFKAEPANVRRGDGRYCSRACARAPKQTPEERFWSYIEKTSTCWVWKGSTTKKGYGLMSVGGRKGKQIYTHRFSWELHNGIITDTEKEVCHTCDNPPCVNPEHLFLGTHLENMQDASSKGRFPGPGFSRDSHPMSKLTSKKVEEIRARYAKGDIFQRELAEQYGVNQVTISRVVLGKHWK